MVHTTYVVLREFDDPMADEALEGYDERVAGAVEALRHEGQALEWLESIRLVDETTDVDGSEEGQGATGGQGATEARVVGTIDRYRADRRETLEALAERSEIPETKVWREGGRRDGERVDRRQGR